MSAPDTNRGGPADHRDMPRPFLLYRHTDPTGVSGTGVVATGAAFADGTVALHWNGAENSTAVWPGPSGLERITEVHGHHGATAIVWAVQPG